MSVCISVCVFVTVSVPLFFRVLPTEKGCSLLDNTFVVSFGTILISSNGNICYSLFTLSAVSHFASH